MICFARFNFDSTNLLLFVLYSGLVRCWFILPSPSYHVYWRCFVIFAVSHSMYIRLLEQLCWGVSPSASVSGCNWQYSTRCLGKSISRIRRYIFSRPLVLQPIAYLLVLANKGSIHCNYKLSTLKEQGYQTYIQKGLNQTMESPSLNKEKIHSCSFHWINLELGK